MIEEVMENHRTADEVKSEEHDQAQIDYATDFLLRSRYNEIFYRSGEMAYLIPIQCSLGYKAAPLRAN